LDRGELCLTIESPVWAAVGALDLEGPQWKARRVGPERQRTPSESSLIAEIIKAMKTSSLARPECRGLGNLRLAHLRPWFREISRYQQGSGEKPHPAPQYLLYWPRQGPLARSRSMRTPMW